MRTEKKIPELRFPEFEGEWQQNTLGEIATILKGKGISKNDICENGNSECILYGELYTHYTEVIKNIKSKTNLDHKTLVFSKSNDVIIPSSGETQIDIATASCVTKDGVAFGGDLNIIRGNANGVFLSFYLNNKKKKDIAQLAQGISVVHLYGSQLKSLLLKLPTLPEQQKIASFLSAADQRIHLLTQKNEKLEQYKKGIMQQIFSQQLRFKDENGKDYPDWEEKRLGDCLRYEQPTKYLVESVEYSDNYNIPVITAGKTFILGYTDEKDGIFKNDLPIILFDDFTTATQFVNFPFKLKSSAAKILLANDNLDIKFIYELMQMIKFEIGGHGRHWISVFSNLIFDFPIYEEQQKIASFLSSLDEKISLVNQQIELTRKWKQGLLQKMFV
jgi:type I restriction enzyme S subunit